MVVGGRIHLGIDAPRPLVLLTGVKHIRHCGLLAPSAQTERFATGRRLLAMPAADPRAAEQVQAFMQRVAAIGIERCTHCSNGR